MSTVFDALTASVAPFGRRAAPDLPAIAINMVTSVDGATTLDGRVGRLTGPADQALLRRLREEADAVLVGAATVRAERYSRLLRDEARERRAAERGAAEPLLVVASRSADLGPGSPALATAPGPLIFMTSAEAELPDAEREVLALRAPSSTVALRPLLVRLREEHGVERVICEGGGVLNGTLLAEGVVGELFVAISPLIAREPGSPPLVAGVADPAELELIAHTTAGDFAFLRYGLRRSAR
jgi:riboflavin biosynthesis pyrimidine reductase